MIDTSENIDTSIGLGSIQSCVIVNCEGKLLLPECEFSLSIEILNKFK